jgi:hypothetical protein
VSNGRANGARWPSGQATARRRVASMVWDVAPLGEGDAIVPMIRCPHCQLRQYAAVTHSTRAECVGCARPLAPTRPAPIAPTPVITGRAARWAVDER